MTTRSILQAFHTYQKARLHFVQTVAELALRAQNIDILEQAGALSLLKPLLGDVCPQIQNCAAIALGRLAHASAKLAANILNQDYLPMLLNNIDRQNKHYKRSALFVLRSLCKHDHEMAKVVASSGGLEALMICIEDFEPSVKEGACWAMGYIARHNKDLAQCVVDAGAIPHIARTLNTQDEKLKRQVLAALSACAKHSTELAEVVVEAEIFPSVLIHMAHACPIIRKNAACLVRDIVKHSLELTQLVVNTGGIGALMEALRHMTDDARVPCITALGYIAGHSDQLAISVLGCEGIVNLMTVLNDSTDDATLSVTVWTLGQIAKHSPEHSNAVAAANGYPRLLSLYMDANSSEDLKYKCKTSLKQGLQKCLLLSALEPLLYDAPPNILKYILGQFSKVLPNDPKARRMFVTTGGLKKVQEIEAEPGTTLMEYKTVINACYPEEIVRYYSPGYSETLLDKVDEYNPQVMTILREAKHSDEDVQTSMTVIEASSPTHSQELETLVKGQ